jgi:hypothetical protein
MVQYLFALQNQLLLNDLEKAMSSLSEPNFESNDLRSILLPLCAEVNRQPVELVSHLLSAYNIDGRLNPIVCYGKNIAPHPRSHNRYHLGGVQK